MTDIVFAEEAQRVFDPVAERHGMRLQERNEHSLRYEGARAILRMTFYPRDGLAVSFECKSCDAPPQHYSIGDVLGLRGIPYATDWSSHDGRTLPEGLALMASLAEQHAADFFDGNPASFAEVARYRQQATEAWHLKWRLEAARAECATAWAFKDYAGVVKALDPLEQHLSSAEKARLKYSRERLGSPGSTKS